MSNLGRLIDFGIPVIYGKEKGGGVQALQFNSGKGVDFPKVKHGLFLDGSSAQLGITG